MFGVQQPVDIVGGYRGIHMDSFGRAQTFRQRDEINGRPAAPQPMLVSNLRSGYTA
jgi:hypothetical protein